MSLQEFVPAPKFDDYSKTFEDFFHLERNDGVLVARAHTLGGPIQLSVQNHRALGQLLKTVGADPENEVLILSGSGPDFMMESDPAGFELEDADMPYWAYEYAYKDGRINVSALVNDLEIPTIGILNGPGFHTEIVLMCFQELLGVKRAAYALLTGEAITAHKALEWGMVNEVLPRDQLLDRALVIAGHIMSQPRVTRRLTTQIIRRPWRKRIADDLDGGFGIQMFGHVAKQRSIHGRQAISSTVRYVREGRRNNFDPA
jgi:enoyl-CoA hydratase/carnithine racemase